MDGYVLGIAYLTGEGQFVNRQKYPLPRFVLLDYELNGHTGIDVLRWIRGHKSLTNLPVLIYSGSDGAERVELCYQEGANHYLHKAGSFARLQVIVQTLAHCFAAEPPCYDSLLKLAEYRRQT